MKGELGRIVALLGLSALLVSCAQILGEGGLFDDKGTGGGKTTSGETTAAGIGGAPGDTSVTTASDVTSGPSGPSGPSGTGGAPTTSSSVVTTVGSGVGSATSTSTSTSTTTAGSGGGMNCPTNGFDALADEFNGSALDTSKWDYSPKPSSDLMVTGGELLLNSSVTVFSKSPHSLINCYASIMVDKYSGQAGSVHFGLEYVPNTSFLVQIAVAGGYINFEAKGSSLPDGVVHNCEYDVTKHKYWRISATDKKVTWWTSADGTNWNNAPCENGVAERDVSALNFDLSNVKLNFGVSGVSSAVHFDHFDKP